MKIKLGEEMEKPSIQKEPSPKEGETIIVDIVIQDLIDRSKMGRRKYGTVLKTFNGRDALIDAYQEALDLCMYLRQALCEQEKNKMGEK